MDGKFKATGKPIAEFSMPHKISQHRRFQTSDPYRIFFEDASDAIIVSNGTNGNIIEANKAACDLLGYTKKELLQLSLYDIDLQLNEELINQLTAQHPPDDQLSIETTYITRNVRRIPIEVRMSTCTFDQHSAIICFARDLSKYRYLEDPLPQGEQEFKALAENSPDAIIRCDKDLRLVYANPAIKLPTGQSPQDIIGTKLCDLGLKEEDFQLWTRQLTKVFKTKKSIAFQSEFKTSRNKILFYHAHCVPEFSQDGSIQYVLCTLRNITELKKVEQALKKSQDRTHILLNSIPDILFVIDKNGLILDYQASKKTFTTLSKDVLRKSIYDIFPLAVPNLVHAFEKAFISSAVQVFEFRATFNATTSYCEGRITANNENECVFIIRDISELKRLQQHLVRFDRLNLVGEMAVSIGHEIRNPMTTVRGFLQMFHQNADFYNYKDFLEVMISEIDHANTIISEFILLSKNKALTLETQNLNTIINALIPLLQADANIANMQIMYKLDYLPDLKLDNKEIRQLILNLARNGLEAMTSNSKLLLCTYMEEEKVVLAVKDKGMGISHDILEKIATPFFTTKDNHPGLGLAICYSIAARHNAEITFDTTPLGTTFYVKFNVPQH